MKSIKLIGWLWPIEVAVLTGAGIVMAFGWTDKVQDFIPLLPYLAALIAAQGGAAFGGPLLGKKKSDDESATQGIVG